MQREDERERESVRESLYYNRLGTPKKLINNPIKQIETFFYLCEFPSSEENVLLLSPYEDHANL